MSQLPVVVGYNGRRHAKEALVWAAEEATRRGTSLLVLFAANYPGMVSPSGPGLWEMEPGALDAAREVTARGVAAVSESFPELYVTGRTVVTSPAEALIEFSSRASVIVMGSRGRGSVLAGLLGSVAFTVAGSTRCALVIVNEGCGSVAAGPERPVVVGTDGSRAAEAAVAHAAAEAISRSAPLRIMCCTGDTSVPVPTLERLIEAAAGIVERSRSQVLQAHPDLAVTTQVGEGQPERLLVEASRKAGMVVVGSRGRGAFRAMVAGSTACAVIHGARCPAVVVGDTT